LTIIPPRSTESGARRRRSSHRHHLIGSRCDAQQPTRHHAQPAVASKPIQAKPSEARACCRTRGAFAAAGRPCLHRYRHIALVAELHNTTLLRHHRPHVVTAREETPTPREGKPRCRHHRQGFARRVWRSGRKRIMGRAKASGG
jgi:hypothetical protein